MHSTSNIVASNEPAAESTNPAASAPVARPSVSDEDAAADGSWRELWHALGGAASAAAVRLTRAVSGAGRPPPPPPPAPLLSERERQALVCKWGPLFEQAVGEARRIFHRIRREGGGGGGEDGGAAAGLSLADFKRALCSHLNVSMDAQS